MPLNINESRIAYYYAKLLFRRYVTYVRLRERNMRRVVHPARCRRGESPTDRSREEDDSHHAGG